MVALAYTSNKIIRMMQITRCNVQIENSPNNSWQHYSSIERFHDCPKLDNVRVYAANLVKK